MVSCLRTNFARYHPLYEEVKERNRVEIPNFKKDGTPTKKPSIWYRCDGCDENVKQKDINIDHIVPVVEIGKRSQDYTLTDLEHRIEDKAGSGVNLQVLCIECHDVKSAEERGMRKSAKPDKGKNKHLKKMKTKREQLCTLKTIGCKVEDYIWNKEEKRYKHKSLKG